MSSADDAITIRPGESQEAFRQRRAAEAKEEFENRKKFLENYTSRELKYDPNILKKQIVDMQNEMLDRFGDETDTRQVSYEEKSYFETRYAYLFAKGKTIFERILQKRYLNGGEFKLIMEIHKKIASGELTVYEASQVFQKYIMRTKMNINPDDEMANKAAAEKQTAWDMLRSKNSFADPSLYEYSDDDNGDDGDDECAAEEPELI